MSNYLRWIVDEAKKRVFRVVDRVELNIWMGQPGVEISKKGSNKYQIAFEGMYDDIELDKRDDENMQQACDRYVAEHKTKKEKESILPPFEMVKDAILNGGTSPSVLRHNKSSGNMINDLKAEFRDANKIVYESARKRKQVEADFKEFMEKSGTPLTGSVREWMHDHNMKKKREGQH